MTITLNGSTGITNDGGYTGDGVSFADTTPANTLVTTTDGRVGIGIANPSVKLDVRSNSGVAANFFGNDGNNYIQLSDNNGTNAASVGSISGGNFYTYTAGYSVFYTGGANERMRIDSSGNVLVGKTVADGTSQVGTFLQPTGQLFVTANTDAAYNSYHLYNINATNNGFRFYVKIDGGVVNFSGNNTNLSDERTKKNIEVSGNYLDKICAIPVKLFNYKDEEEGEQKTLGVVAQDVEAVAPEFVNNDGWEGAAPEDGVPLKTIYTTDMMFGLMKAIQEQQAIITDLKSRIETLESK
jgi:hypothetical protein